MLCIMSKEEKVDLSRFLYDLNRQVKDKISRLKKENPLLLDYLDLESNELEKQFRDILSRSPIIAEDEAMVFFNHNRVSKNLSKIEHGGFPYLWDEKLYTPLKKAMDLNLGITNKWVKALIVSNILELSLNQVLSIFKKDQFKKLIDASIKTKMDEVNEILKSKDLKKLDWSEIEFIKANRVYVDHPVPENISEIKDENVERIINYVDNALECLKPLFDAEKFDSEFETEIVEKGPFKRGDSFTTKIKFRGKLVGGFFDNRIEAPVGKIFPHGSEIWWCPDPYTAPGPMDKPGNLVGEGEWEAKWMCKIQDNYPIGKYKVNICVYDHLGEGNRPVIKEKTITIDVVE